MHKIKTSWTYIYDTG